MQKKNVGIMDKKWIFFVERCGTCAKKNAKYVQKLWRKIQSYKEIQGYYDHFKSLGQILKC